MDKVIPRDDLGDYEDEPFDVVRLYECLQDEEFRKQKLYIATDGGAIPDIGSLRFLLTDSEGNPFRTCYGQLAGYEPKSYCCEICAALAAVRLLGSTLNTLMGNLKNMHFHRVLPFTYTQIARV